MKRNTYDRQTLYQEVWQEPMLTVARRYGISDVMLKKICKQLDVPTPPRGYWAKLNAGKKVEQTKLPHSSKNLRTYGKGMDEAELDRKDEMAKRAKEGPTDYLLQLEPNQLAFIQKIAADTEYKLQIHLRPSLKAIMAEEKQFGEIKTTSYSEHKRMEEIVLAIFNTAVKYRNERLEEEKGLRKEQKRVKETQKKVDLYNAEVDKFEATLREAALYHESTKLRQYAKAFREKQDPELLEYAQWIEAKANWVDPLVNTEDRCFSQIPKDGLVPPRARKVEIDHKWHDNELIIERGLEKSNKAWEEFAELAEKRS